ncbi:hypothetical protein TNCV_1141201 [Trichonephila clavipes]|nr:hypothetical protein TNCV_1141201 [Trichonephila clavipes]
MLHNKWFRWQGRQHRPAPIPRFHGPTNHRHATKQNAKPHPRQAPHRSYHDKGLRTELQSRRPKCIASVLSVFSSIVREFLELFYNLWRTVLAKNKIVLDSALRLQSFRTPKTQQLVSEVGLNANNKSDGGPVPDSSRKIDRQHECQMK